MGSAFDYFEQNINIIENSLRSVRKSEFEALLEKCILTLKENKKIIVTGLGKNTPICQKFVSTMISMGLDAYYIDAVSALHGDIGMVKQGDLVIILTKSASTVEISNLTDLLKRRNICYWIVTNNKDGFLAKKSNNVVYVELEHEGDIWNIIPNNSSTLNLIILQTIATNIAEALGLTLENDFKPNHPGGAIGAKLYNEN